MPYRDRSGPRGEGPLTGGGYGACGTGRAGRFGAWPLVGLGLGLGMRHAWRAGARYMRRHPGWGYGRFAGRGYGPEGAVSDGPWYEPASREQEAEALQAEAEGLREEASFLQRQLEAMEARIAALREDKDETGQDG